VIFHFKRYFLIWLIGLFLFPALAFGQASKYHYIPPLTTINGENTNPQEVEIYISTPSSSVVNYTIWPLPINNSTKYTGTLSKLSPSAAVVSGTDYYFSSSGYGQLIVPHTATGSVTSDKGYYIEANEAIYVNVRYNADAQAGALVSKGEAALGTSFRAGGFANQKVSDGGYISYVSVLATEEGSTTVTFSDIAGGENSDLNWMDFENISEVYGGSGEVSDIVITLKQYESFILAHRMNSGNFGSGTNNGTQGAPYPDSNNDGIIGTAIDSDRKIAVVVGGANGSMTSTQNGRDNGVDQIVGADKIGNEFIFIRGNPNEGTLDYDDAIIVANEDGTEVFLNGSLTATATLNAGDYFVIDEEDYDTGSEASGAEHNIYVRTSKNAYAYQFISNGQSANTEMFFVPALSCTSLENAEYIPDIERVGSTSYDGFVILVAPATASITFTDKNNTTAKWTGDILNTASLVEGPDPVTGKPEYVTYKLENLEGNVSIFSSNSDGSQAELYAAYYGSSGVATQGAFYSGFPMPPENQFNEASIAGYGNCIPNISLTIPNDNLYDSIEWKYWDGNGAVNYNTVPGWTTKTVTPTDVGFYKAIGVISCTTKIYRLESSVKKVSNCPLDLDGDGIINNIDVDIDNDGIYNTVESRAINNFDISDIADPMIIFSDTSTNTSIPGGAYTSNGSGVSLTGQTSGAFESTLTAGSKNGIYNVFYTQPVNFVLDEDVNFTHTLRDGEKYSISVFPVSQTITLLDPGDELKIDTNQNGIYDSGIVTITSNEILFTFNSSTSASDKFSFQADGITEIKFIHIADGTSGSSVFNGVMKMKYLPIDTDSDSIYNIYDYDSDADGCFDTIEAGFTDNDSNGKIGTDPIVVDGMLAAEPGKVNNQGQGYTTPNDLNTDGTYDFLENTVSPTFSVEPVDAVICPGNSASFTASSTQPGATFLWQKYNTGTSVWENLTNNATYSGVTSPTLTLTSPSSSTLDNSEYRVVLSKDEYVCYSISATATLKFIYPGITACTVIPSNGLILALDASNPDSYPGSGTTWYDISGKNAHAEALNLPSFGLNGDSIKNFDFDGVDDEFHGVDISQEYRDLIVITKLEKPTNFAMLFSKYDNQDASMRFFNGELRNPGNNQDWYRDQEADAFINGQFNRAGYNVFNTWSFIRTYRTNTDGFGTDFRYELSSSFAGRRYGGKVNLILAYDRKLSDQEVIDIYNLFSSRLIGNETSSCILSVTEGGATDIFGFSLSDQPSSDVVINLTANPTSQFTVSPTSFTFTNSNWNSTQSATLTAVDDLLLDGTVTGSITLEIDDPLSDDCYDSLTSKSYIVSVLDNENAGYIVTPVVGTLTESDTTTASFDVVLTTQPINDVIIDFTNSDSTEKTLGVTSATFTNATWNVTQTIILNSADDFLIDGDQTTSITAQINPLSDAGFTGSVSQTISVITKDNDSGDFILGSISGNLTEDPPNTVNFSVVLTAQPSSTVIIDFSSGDLTEATMVTNSVSFTSGNWNIPVLVYVSSVDELIFDGSQTTSITATVSSSSDPGFTSASSQIINVITEDNDKPSYTVNPVVGALTEGDMTTVYFTVILDATPSSNVIINLANGDPSEVTLSTTSITFTPANWNVTQTITLFSEDDPIIDGPQNTVITASINGLSDPNFASLDDQTVSVITNDNDSASVKVTVIDNLTSEYGDTGSFEMVLESQPTGEVTIDLISSNLLEGKLIDNSVTFNSSNWDTPQVVSVEGIDDSPPISDGAIVFNIITGNVTSSDPNFGLLDGTTIDDVSMTNQDNDAPGIIVSLLNNDFTTSESGDFIIVQFNLLAKPNGGANVTIPLSLSGPSGEMILSKNSITIANSDWDKPSSNQVTITGLDDIFIDGDQNITLVTGDPTSADSINDALDAESVANPILTNLDNDFPEIIVNVPNSVSEDGTTSDLLVKLGAINTSNVYIDLSLSDQSELGINTYRLTFKPENWNIEQSIIITGQDDLLLDGDINSIVFLNVDVMNSDPQYKPLPRVSIIVTNLDNEKDGDNDFIENGYDNCPDISNPNQEDLDNDGIGDLCDPDIDGDGVTNTNEGLDNTDPKNACSFNSLNITIEVTTQIDCDGDGAPDENDLDSDNDGILDTEEGNDDIDNDGIPNYLDLDSDGDNCPDVLEAGFEDGDNDGLLGSSPLSFDSSGRVISSSGYTKPNDLDSNGIDDYLEFGSEIVIIKQPKEINSINPGLPITLSVDSESEGTRNYKWQLNNSGQSITSKKQTWVSINDSNLYTGTDTEILTIISPTNNMIGWKYRVKIFNDCYVCGDDITSEESLLSNTDLIIPNAFSPDGDGVNDTWVIEGLEYYPIHHLKVYNRWEAKVYESINYQSDWGGIQQYGTTLGNDNNLPEGTYFYILELGNSKKPIKGFVFIKRKKW